MTITSDVNTAVFKMCTSRHRRYRQRGVTMLYCSYELRDCSTISRGITATKAENGQKCLRVNNAEWGEKPTVNSPIPVPTSYSKWQPTTDHGPINDGNVKGNLTEYGMEVGMTSFCQCATARSGLIVYSNSVHSITVLRVEIHNRNWSGLPHAGRE